MQKVIDQNFFQYAFFQLRLEDRRKDMIVKTRGAA